MDIKEKILKLITETYKCTKYTGHLDIEKLDPVGYKVVFGLNNDERPITISAELPEDKFLKYLRQELRERLFDHIKWFIGYQTYPDQIEISTKK